MSSWAFTPSARADLEEIWSHIAGDNPEAADQIEADIYAACDLLAAHPEAGSLRPRWTDKPVRFWPVRKNYLLVYRPEGRPLVILRIFHAARDVPSLL